MKKDYDLIIFDCDGTLVDSELLCNKVSAGLLNDLGFDEYTSENFMAEFIGNTWTNIYKILEKKHNTKLPADLIAQYVEGVNQSLETDLQIVEGALDFVKLANGKKTCVASNGQRLNVLKSLKVGQFIPNYFDESLVFTSCQVSRGKPEPDLFLFAAEKMNVSPDQCLVIEDSPTGVKAGAAAGMDVYGFTGVAHNKEEQEKELKLAGATAVFDDFIHISKALGY